MHPSVPQHSDARAGSGTVHSVSAQPGMRPAAAHATVRQYFSCPYALLPFRIRQHFPAAPVNDCERRQSSRRAGAVSRKRRPYRTVRTICHTSSAARIPLFRPTQSRSAPPPPTRRCLHFQTSRPTHSGRRLFTEVRPPRKRIAADGTSNDGSHPDCPSSGTSAARIRKIPRSRPRGINSSDKLQPPQRHLPISSTLLLMKLVSCSPFSMPLESRARSMSCFTRLLPAPISFSRAVR